MPGNSLGTPRSGDDDRLDLARDGSSIDVAAAVKHLRSSDATFARLIDVVGPCDMQVRKTTSVFVALSRAIVYQQLNGRAAEAIFTRVCALFPGALRGLTAERLSRVPDAKLRGAGLSLAKTLAMKDLARKTIAGAIPTLAEIRRMNDEEIIERLTEVRGIGRWTVEMLLMFRLGRPDVLPTGDYGVRKGFAIAFRKQALPTTEQLEKRAQRWRPHRTVASWYLWRAVEQAKS